MKPLPYTIMFVGSVPPPVTGQAFSFFETYKGLVCKKKILVGHNLANRSAIAKVAATVLVLLKIVFCLCFIRMDLVYFTSSRTLLGGFKDIVLINLASLFGIRTVNHVHGTGLEDFFSSLPSFARRLYISSYRRIDMNIVLLEQMSNELRNVTSKDRIAVIPNFYDPDLDSGQEKNNRDGALKIVYLSNIIRSKGILELMDAFAVLSGRHADLTLTIAGNFFGDEYLSQDEIRQHFTKRLAALTRVNFPGPVYGHEKSKILFSSDIFVLPTYYSIEAYPIAILEAMRAGNYIIATDHNYIPSMVTPSNGVTIQKQSVQAIVQAVEDVMANRAKLRQVQAHNMQYARNNYSLATNLERISALFEKVKSEHGH